MKAHDLIEVQKFPAVVQAADIAALRETKDSDAARDFMGGYLGFDERARHALSTALASLSAPQRGGAFFLNGVFGSGKSHLLGLLALLCENIGREFFLETHPHFVAAFEEFPKFFVVHFSLDEYDAARFSLEEICKTEIAREFEKRFGEKLPLPDEGTRGEYFLALEEMLAARVIQKIFIGIDELSLFLSAKEHRALQADAAWLQFLGQRAARSTPCPLNFFAALQKTVEDIGDLEAYSLSQIRDRFQTLQLSLAHIPSLIERRLIIRKNENALQSVCRDSYDELAQALPRLDFGREEWAQLFPFHPATISLLENVVARFFSRTRSAALFCSHAAQHFLVSNADANTRVLPDALFDYIAPELENHPELRALLPVWNAWQESLPELAGDAHDVAWLQSLMKTLLLFKIAGSAPTVIQMANAIALDANLGGEKNYEYARVLLERIRSRGSFLAVERNAGDWQDRYAIDLGTRVSELARRQVKNAAQQLRLRDARISQFVLSSCRDEPLPLASFSTSRNVSIFWMNAPREIAVEILSSQPSTHALQNRAAMLMQTGTREDFLLLIAPPFLEIDASAQLSDLQLEARARAAVVLWTPRAPTDDEWQSAHEATASHLLEDDPQLLDNRRGRAILEHLKDQSAARQNHMAEIALQLLREGEISTAAGAVLDASDLSSGETWTSTLEAIAEFALPRVYEKFESVAPRARVLTPSNADALCLEILRRPADEPFFAATHERIARALCEPLGIARSEKSRWKISSPREDLKREVLSIAQDASTLSQLDAHFSRGAWGLKIEQLALVVCALLRGGELIGVDARGKILLPNQIGMPLRRSIHAVRAGQLLDENSRAQLQKIVELFTGETLSAHSFSAQERARVLLSRWRDDTQSQMELAHARLNQLRRALHHQSAQWPQTENLLSQIAELSSQLESDSMLERAANLDSESVQPIVTAWRAFSQKLDARHAPLISIHALLSHPDLSTPAELQTARNEILERLQTGEAILDDEDLIHDATRWREEYARLYREWHATQNDAARWNSLRRILNSDELRALEQLSTLRARPFSQAQNIRSEIQSELQKQCGRDGNLLPGEATCNACRLRLGALVSLRAPREIETQIAQAFAAFAQGLQEVSVREYLSRHTAARELLQWKPDAPLLPILNAGVLALLEAAFKPRRRVSRSRDELNSRLKNCRTRAEFESAFESWLDGEENLAADDEVELS